MKTVIARVLREPAALLGVVTATLGLLTLLEVFNPEVAGSVGVLLGAIIALGRFIVTPTAEVVAQVRPDGSTFVAHELPPSVDQAVIALARHRDQATRSERGVARVAKGERFDIGDDDLDW